MTYALLYKIKFELLNNYMVEILESSNRIIGGETFFLRLIRNQCIFLHCVIDSQEQLLKANTPNDKHTQSIIEHKKLPKAKNILENSV